MSDYLEKELRELGLSAKEAKVYLASLEIGPATAQEIAIKAEVNRPTTYVMIESLTSQGLMSQFEKGKKRYFSAESPESFEVLLEKERSEVEDKQKKISKIVRDLRALMKFAAKPPTVRYYEGLDGVTSLRQDLINSNEKELFEIVPLDTVRKFISPDLSPDDLRKKIDENVSTKAIYSTRDGHSIKTGKGRVSLRKYSSEKELPCEVVVFGDMSVFMTFSGKPAGFVIESKEVAEMMKLLFNSLWESSEN